MFGNDRRLDRSNRRFLCFRFDSFFLCRLFKGRGFLFQRSLRFGGSRSNRCRRNDLLHRFFRNRLCRNSRLFPRLFLFNFFSFSRRRFFKLVFGRFFFRRFGFLKGDFFRRFLHSGHDRAASDNRGLDPLFHDFTKFSGGQLFLGPLRISLFQRSRRRFNRNADFFQTSDQNLALHSKLFGQFINPLFRHAQQSP